MERATQAAVWFLQCGGPAEDEKFTVLCGGHSNFGGSVETGRRLLDVRFMNRVKPYLDKGKMNDDGGASNDIGSVLVGAGSTAGRAVAFTYVTDEKFPSSVAFLPVGQRPSVGISGLTLGGGFGFLTRFAGLTCDRLKSLTAIVPTTPEGRPQNITKDNEYSDLFWASCGGGGGNFAVITDFEFNAVQIWCDPSNTKPGCNVLQIEMILPASVDVVSFYQDWSMSISTRITANMEVYNTTHVMIVGIFLGNTTLWDDAVDRSLATETTPISSIALKKSIHMKDIAEATVDLTGWTPGGSPLDLLRSFYEKRSYFIYKSYWLFEPLPEEAIKILVEESMVYPIEDDGDTFVIFEYQSVGGDPGADDLDDDGAYPYWSPQNKFASVPPKDTAFPHRGARHCLMFKAQSFDEASANEVVQEMERVYQKIAPFVKGGASYYNHIDPTLPIETPYFKNGVELNPGVTEDDKDYWVDRFREIRAKYNPLGMMVNTQALD